jgi:hypothetical protein
MIIRSEGGGILFRFSLKMAVIAGHHLFDVFLGLIDKGTILVSVVVTAQVEG